LWPGFPSCPLLLRCLFIGQWDFGLDVRTVHALCLSQCDPSTALTGPFLLRIALDNRSTWERGQRSSLGRQMLEQMWVKGCHQSPYGCLNFKSVGHHSPFMSDTSESPPSEVSTSIANRSSQGTFIHLGLPARSHPIPQYIKASFPKIHHCKSPDPQIQEAQDESCGIILPQRQNLKSS
jgi:hypothetical protein